MVWTVIVRIAGQYTPGTPVDKKGLAPLAVKGVGVRDLAAVTPAGSVGTMAGPVAEPWRSAHGNTQITKKT